MVPPFVNKPFHSSPWGVEQSGSMWSYSTPAVQPSWFSSSPSMPVPTLSPVRVSGSPGYSSLTEFSPTISSPFLAVSSLGGSTVGVSVPVRSVSSQLGQYQLPLPSHAWPGFTDVAVPPFSGSTMSSAVGDSFVHPVGAQAFSGVQHQQCPPIVRRMCSPHFLTRSINEQW
ncbi:hypothetical protein Tsubulata_001316 [Turnera subulata]|uniref:Uncharacterized protein n=1 Tax=Turnera subulata TaxID=218843 RepID=A0A9Q0FEN4_9ROSI|nr:hypothetical protein Tsubulata_001316 [Turnera subulata]